MGLVLKVSLHTSLRSLACFCLCISLCWVCLGQPRAVADPLCQITNISANYQQPVPPNQQIQLSTIVTGVCSPAEQQVFYTARVDIGDTTRNQVLSMASVPIGYLTVQPNFVVTVPNFVTTPNVVAAWQLTIVVYLFANFEFVANGIDASAVDNISVQVGTVQTTTASIAQTTLALVTVTTSSTSTSAQSTPMINEVAPIEPIWQQIQTIVSLTVVAIIAILLLALLCKSRKSRATRAS